MSVQLIVYPQNYQGFSNSNNPSTELIVDGINFTPKKTRGFEQLSKLPEYSLQLINETDNNLIHKLLNTHLKIILYF